MKKATTWINENIEGFVTDYLITAAWVTVESNECSQFTKDAKEMAKTDCIDFVNKVFIAFPEHKAERLLNTKGNDLGFLAAHDFFLTRNRHGAGFWDKEDRYGDDESKILTEIAHECGEADCYHIRGKKSKLSF